MNQELKQIYNYCALNRLPINNAKTNYMLVSSSSCHPKIIITGTEQKDYIKFLGVYLDKHLSWQLHIQHVNNNLAKNLGILSKVRYYRDLNILKQIYYALIYPYLSDGILAWGCASKTRLDCLHIKHNRLVASHTKNIRPDFSFWPFP